MRWYVLSMKSSSPYSLNPSDSKEWMINSIELRSAAPSWAIRSESSLSQLGWKTERMP
jgi:hypothetical protein